MAFDNIKLDKGLYATSKGFAAALEEIDPSENYIGTELEGLDAYQRQLKRFNIKVSGEDSDSISKFFATTDSAALFPEYVSRAVKQGMEENDSLSEIIATVTNIDSLDYRSIESVPDEEDKELAMVGEGAFIPHTTIKTKETLTRLHKRGRILTASYEAIKFQKLDLFTVTLKQIGSYIAQSQFVDALTCLTNSENIVLDSAEVSYDNLIDIWGKLSPYKFTSLIAGVPVISKLLKMEEFRDAAAGLNFHSTGSMITPFGAKIVKCNKLPDNVFVVLDKNAAIEKVQAGGVKTEYDKLIDRQLERVAITDISGFSPIFEDAAKVVTLGE